MTAIVEPNTKPQADRASEPASAVPRIEVARPVVLAARGLRKAFGGQVVLDGVDLELREGEVILLRGDNGSGKTTLINILTGNLEPDAGAIQYLADGSPREFRFPRRWWQELNPFDHFTPESTAQEGIGRMWQDVRLFNSQTLRDNIAVAEPRHLGENPIRAIFTPGRCCQQESEIARKADEMLARLGLAGRETSSGDKISLGQSKRVAIARAVAAGARILFLDEPLAGLDRQGITDVLTLLESVARESAVTLIIVEHVFNHPHLHGLITSAWLLECSKLQQNGTSDGYSGPQPATPNPLAPARPAWFSLLASESDIILDESLPRGALITRLRRTDCFQSPPKPVLKIRGLVVKRGLYSVIGFDDHGQTPGFDLTLYEGEIAILQAPNGWGKSTLFGAICGLIPVDCAEISLAGESIRELPVWNRIRKGLRPLASDHHTFSKLTVKESLLLAGRTDAAELGPFSDRSCSSLSGGERQRIAFAGAFQQPESAALYILDEPFGAYDLKALETSIQRISSHPRKSTLILMPSPQAIA
jgi:ABC-type branched-subunit amino acid transport system ATPase component